MIDLVPWIEWLGDAGAAAALGGLFGAIFGILAQRSGFCARSAVIDATHGRAGASLLTWSAGLGAGLVVAAWAMSNGLIGLAEIPARVQPGSLSGAIIGGLMFGAGMILARGCISRHLVLAASGNLRAVVVFSVFATVAWAAIWGPLAPMQSGIANLWRISPASGDIAALAGAGPHAAFLIGGLILVLAVAFGFVLRRRPLAVLGGALIGTVIAVCWIATSWLAGQTFEPTQIESLALTAPAAHAFSAVASGFDVPWSFDIGLVPGIAAGSLIAAFVAGDFRWAWFSSLASSTRYLAGAVLMGFGAVLAVGCSVGALSSALILVTSSVVALVSMGVGGAVAQLLVGDGAAVQPAALAQAGRRNAVVYASRDLEMATG